MRCPALLALALLVSDAAAAAASCPDGDGPGILGDLEIVRVVTRVDVVGGAAAVRTEVSLRNTGTGPASAILSLSSEGDVEAPPLVLQQARIVGGDRTALERADVADERYDAFVEALENGVEKEDARGGRRVALQVKEARHGELTVEVAAACSARTITVELVGAVLAEPTSGGERLVVPAVFDRDELVVTTTSGAVWVDGRRLRDGRTRRTRTVAEGEVEPDAGAPFVIEVARDDAGLRLQGALTRVSAPAPKKATTTDDDDVPAPSPLLADGFALLGATLAVPQPMSAAPPALKLVFVVDASVSAGDEGVARSLGLLQAVLDAAPDDASWALVAMRRRAELVVPPWQPRSRRFVPQLPVENGSDAADALGLAVKIASDAEAGTGRVILLSDLQQKDGDEPRLVRALGAVDGPVVHVLRMPEDMGVDEALGFTRVIPGGEPLATATTAARGVFLDVHSDSDARDDRALATHLIRPTRLDDLQVIVDGRALGPLDELHTMRVLGFGHQEEVGDDALPGWIGEGGGLRIASTLPASTSRVQLRGLAWAEEVTLELQALPKSAGAVAAAVVTNSDLRRTFDDAPDALEAVARQLGYVSAATSLVAVPAFRPARPDGFGMRGYGSCCGCGGCHMSGMGRSYSGCGLGIGKTLKAREILDALATEIAAACHADVDATIEVRDLEILDVKAAGSGRACVAARLWASRLDQLTPGDGSFEAQGSFPLQATWAPPDDTP